MSSTTTAEKPARLASLDAYRGFIMLAMVSGGFGFAKILSKHPEVVSQFDGTGFGAAWAGLWRILAYQFDHVVWTGCGFWDLIQPSFMFMVGVAMPFSYARRVAEGESAVRRFGHVLLRAAVLVVLAVFLSSNWNKQTNFTFVNVLAQIGLGYPFVYLLVGRRPVVQLAAVVAILGGSWYFFYDYSIPPQEQQQIQTYLAEVKHPKNEPAEFTGIAAHWNKHTNAAAAVDREFLNRFPREDAEWNGRRYWVNDGGYQTLNFVPSMATMLLGLMAGSLLCGPLEPRRKLNRLLGAGVVCVLIAMAVDTTIWPVHIPGCDWSFCPVVKRIWTPSWALFSSGWTFWMLAGFYWVIDIKGYRRWSFALAVVGINSIAIYCMSQLISPWVGNSLKIHFATVDQALHTRFNYFLFDDAHLYGPLWQSIGKLCVLWLICLWMYRSKLFVKI